MPTGSKLPLAIDLYCGLGGWTDGLLAEGYRVVGFDNEQHVYGEARYPAQLVLQDVLTLHGRQFKDAALIVASPPCQAFSYMAMPWTRAKQIAKEYRDGTLDLAQLTALFDACFRIQREACEAAGRHIPLVVENVRGAQPWVGRARTHWGSFYLWGDVPALMPIVKKAIKGRGGPWFKDADTADGKYGSGNFRNGVDGVKVTTMGAGWYPPDHPKHAPGLAFNGHADRALRGQKVVGQNPDGRKHDGGGWLPNGCLASSNRMVPDGRKVCGDWFGSYADMKAKGTISPGRLHGKGSEARKAASAHIAKIPAPLSRWIARAWHP